MFKIDVQIWSREDGQKFVMVPYEQYQTMREQLEDTEDFQLLQQSKIRHAGAKTIPMAEMKQRLGMTKARRRKSTVR